VGRKGTLKGSLLSGERASPLPAPQDSLEGRGVFYSVIEFWEKVHTAIRGRQILDQA